MSHLKVMTKQYLGQQGLFDDEETSGMDFWDWWYVSFQSAISVLSIFGRKSA